MHANKFKFIIKTFNQVERVYCSNQIEVINLLNQKSLINILLDTNSFILRFVD